MTIAEICIETSLQKKILAKRKWKTAAPVRLVFAESDPSSISVSNSDIGCCTGADSGGTTVLGSSKNDFLLIGPTLSTSIGILLENLGNTQRKLVLRHIILFCNANQFVNEDIHRRVGQW